MTVKKLTQILNGRLEPTASKLDADLVELSKTSGNQIQLKEDGLYVPYSGGVGTGSPFSVLDWDVRNVTATPINFTTSPGAIYKDGILRVDPAVVDLPLTNETIYEGINYTDSTLIRDIAESAAITFIDLSTCKLELMGPTSFTLYVHQGETEVVNIICTYDGSVLTATSSVSGVKVFAPDSVFYITVDVSLSFTSTTDSWYFAIPRIKGDPVNFGILVQEDYTDNIKIYSNPGFSMITNTYEKIPSNGLVTIKPPTSSFLLLFVSISDNILEGTHPDDFLLYFYGNMLIATGSIQVEDIWQGRPQLGITVSESGMTIDGVLYPYPGLSSLSKLRIMSFSGSPVAASPVEFTTISFSTDVMSPTERPVDAIDGQIYRIINNGIYDTYELLHGDFVTFYNNLSNLIFTRNVDALLSFIENVVVHDLEVKVDGLTTKTDALETSLASKANVLDVRQEFKGRVNSISDLPRASWQVQDGDYAILGLDPSVQNELYIFNSGSWSPLKSYNFTSDSIIEGRTNKFLTAETYTDMAKSYYAYFDEDLKSALARVAFATSTIDNETFGISHKSYTDTSIRLLNSSKIEVLDQPNTTLVYKTDPSASVDGGFSYGNDIAEGSTAIVVYSLDEMKYSRSNSWMALFQGLKAYHGMVGKIEIGLCEVHNQLVSERCYFLITDGRIQAFYNTTEIDLNSFYYNSYDMQDLRIQREDDKFYVYGRQSNNPYRDIKVKVPYTDYNVWRNVNIYIKYYAGASGYYLNKAEVKLQHTYENR